MNKQQPPASNKYQKHQLPASNKYMKELKAKHEEALLTLERTKTKLENAEQDQKQLVALHLEDVEGFGKKVQVLTTRNEELGQKLKEVIAIQQEEMKEKQEIKVAKDKARCQCLDGMLF